MSANGIFTHLNNVIITSSTPNIINIRLFVSLWTKLHTILHFEIRIRWAQRKRRGKKISDHYHIYMHSRSRVQWKTGHMVFSKADSSFENNLRFLNENRVISSSAIESGRMVGKTYRFAFSDFCADAMCCSVDFCGCQTKRPTKIYKGVLFVCIVLLFDQEEMWFKFM